jgi:arginyl-tRNA synthetase
MSDTLTPTITDLVKSAFNQLDLTPPDLIELDTQPQQGEVSTNVAMKVFSGLGDSRFSNPRALAQAVVDELNSILRSRAEKNLDRVELAGPGFINFYVSEHFLQSEIGRFADEGQQILPNLNNGKKVILEFTDPNPFKEFHIGHLYSNTVGESISRLYEHTGAEVMRVCYQGDVGMHVAKSVWGMRKKLLDENMTLEDLESMTLNQRVKFLGQAYALGATAFEENEESKLEIQEINFLTFVSAQEFLKESTGWEPQVDYLDHLKNSSLDYQEIKNLYQKGRAWSLDYFNQMYSRLGMKFDDFFFESLVGEFGVKLVRDNLAKGTFRESQGAIIFPGREYGLHDRVFINSLGLPTYECKELGLAPEKYRRFPYDLSIIITGNEIDEYFKVLLTALKEIKPDLASKTKHLSHGMVRLPEGKMSSRTGKILTGEWLLDEATRKILEVLNQNRPEIEESQRQKIAEKVGLAAIKYAFLKGSIGTDISFNFDESLSFQGNSGPYLQYSYVRAHSILEKAKALENRSVTKHFDTSLYSLNHSEKAVAKVLYRFPLVVEAAATEYAPHHLATYLYELAQSFNVFYTETSVLGDDVEAAPRAFRLYLTQAVARVLDTGLNLLGIETVEKM